MCVTPSTGSFYDRMQAERPTAPPAPEQEVVYKIRPRLVSVACQLAPHSGERESFTCTISKEVLLALSTLKAGSRVNLVVPTKAGGNWYLDTDPRPGDGYILPEGRAHFRIRPMSRKRFPGRTWQAQEAKTLVRRFTLGEEIAPGYYQLEPIVEVVSEQAEAARRTGALVTEGLTPADVRKMRRRLAQREARALLRQQAAAGVLRAVEALQMIRLKKAAQKRRVRARKRGEA